eukprot:scaffold12227_cov65-Phaeocystis_antarctica.AAC.1
MPSARTKDELCSSPDKLFRAETRNYAAHFSPRKSLDVKLLATIHGCICLIKIAVPGPTTL